MIRELVADGKRRMESALEALRNEFNTVRTGRASTGLLDRIHVDYYGAKTPLKQMATLATPDPRTISITVYDKSAVNAVVRAIQESDLALTPNTDGVVIRLNIPTLTAERRKDLVKLVKNMAEDGRVAIRNVRRDVIQDLKDLKKEGEISEDDERRGQRGDPPLVLGGGEGARSHPLLLGAVPASCAPSLGAGATVISTSLSTTSLVTPGASARSRTSIVFVPRRGRRPSSRGYSSKWYGPSIPSWTSPRNGS